MYDVFIMDMGGNDKNVAALAHRFPYAHTVRYYSNHLDTLKRCVARAKTSYIWVISSCCEYSSFDFSYRSPPWEAYQIHCFASGKQKNGDTFLIPVAEFNKQKDIEKLEWYKDINYHPGVPRLLWPILITHSEDLTAMLKNNVTAAPYVSINKRMDYDPSLWIDRAYYTFTQSGSVSLAPREISGSLRTQIYDYSHLKKVKTQFLDEKPLDIIYISNGEPQAEQWYKHLVDTVKTGNTIYRIQNVNGRAKAYKAAAELSTTRWFFAVFAKLEVDENFNWLWQPDWLQEPKHYIFNSTNPVNKLEYGHMGIIAYNKALVLDTNDWGLDFTLSKAHAVIPVSSGIAHYNTSPELTWRTAFREVLKLKDDIEKTGSVESEYRLNKWLTDNNADYAIWSVKGAEDALAYFKEVSGDYEKLLNSFEWDWLHEYYSKKYSE